MATKKLTRLEVANSEAEYGPYVPVGIARGSEDGPVLSVIAGVHGTEYAAQQAVAEFWEDLDPGLLKGEVRVVLCADVAAVEAHSAYINPVDGKNLNRVWPGDPDGTLTERIAHQITTDVLSGSTAVIDVHGGEWDEDIDCFIITQKSGNDELDSITLDLAMSLGFPFVEVTEGEQALGRGTASGSAAEAGVSAMTLEAGGRARRRRRHVEAHKYALDNALKQLGIKEGDLIWWDGAPVQLKRGVMLRANVSGLYEPAVCAGQWIHQGELFSRVRGYDGRVLEEISAPESGTVLDVIVARGIKAGGFAGKIGVV